MKRFVVDSGLENADRKYVRVETTHIGKALFTDHQYPKGSIIGEIKGEFFEDEALDDEYTFEFEGELRLDPKPPFRFLNHSCNANCDFELLSHPDSENRQWRNGLFLVANRNIRAGEELTIDYNWPATSAIACHCKAFNCRGWVVSQDELVNVRSKVETV